MKLKIELSTLERERQKITLKIQKEQLALQKKQAELQREREKEQLEFQLEREREQLELQREREQEALKVRERERELQREHAEKQAAIALENRRKELDLETTHHTQRKESEANLQVFHSCFRPGTVKHLRKQCGHAQESQSKCDHIFSNDLCKTINVSKGSDNVVANALSRYSLHFNSTGQTRTCFRCGAKGHVAAGCDAPRAEAPSVFLEDDFLRLSVRGDSPTDPGSVQVPGVVPAAVPAVTPSGPDLSAPPVSSGDLWAPALDLRRSVDVTVHPHPVASVVALDGAVRVAAASPAEEHVLVGAVVSMTPPMPSASSPLVVSSLTRASSPLPVLSPPLDTSRVLESNLPPAVSLPSPNPVSLDGSGFLPCVVEAAVLRGRAAPALGQPADGSFGAPLVGGDSSDDQWPISMCRRSARDASPHRTWAEERDAMDDDAVGGDVLPSVLDTVPPCWWLSSVGGCPM
ncbi:protein enabled homolog [Procambarus clarkii]|uniref:protein enabled homolog n=1 Tax=Procambarus clarkii TaxID=6728 RepID=UPI003742728D